jgi:hypothetical protein
MIFHTMTIKLNKLGQSFRLIPFACTHWDHPGCHQALFQRFVERGSTPGVYTLGLGDYLDFARSSYRTELRKVLPDEDSPEHLDALVADRVDKFYEVIKPIAPGCLGLIEGNHSWTWMTNDRPRGILAGETTTEYLCKKLGVPYLGHTAMVTLNVQVNQPRLTDRYIIIANHGYGGGGSTGSADLGRMERSIEPAFDADCYITAHTHRRLAYIMPELVLDQSGAKFVEKPHLLVKAGAFLRGYLPDRTTYADRKMLRPLDLGWVEIEIGYEKEGNRTDRVVQCSMRRAWQIAGG